MEQEEFKYDAFLSFNSDDEGVANELYSFLKRKRLRIFFLPVVKIAGTNQEIINHGLTKSQTMLLLISKNGFGPYQKNEYDTFYDIHIKNPNERKIYVIPTDTYIENILKTQDYTLYPATMVSFNRYHFYEKKDYNKLEMNKLVSDFNKKNDNGKEITQKSLSPIKSKSSAIAKKEKITPEPTKEKPVVEVLFKPRNEFIIIGLTGRTGSGCSTVAGLLSEKVEKNGKVIEEKFVGEDRFDFHSDDDNDERKYKICNNYLIENWKSPAIVIKVTHLILLLCLKDGFNDFLNKLDVWIKLQSEEQEQEIKVKIKELNKEIREIKKSVKESERIYKIKRIIEIHKTEINTIKTDESTKKGIVENIKNILISDIIIPAELGKKANEVHRLLLEMDEPQAYRKDPNELKKITDLLGKNDNNGELYICYEKLKGKLGRDFTKTFQLFGNYIRYRTFFEEDDDNNEHSITSLLHHTIQFYRNINYHHRDKKPTLIVVNALRNPYEITYLRKKYSSFFAMVITTDEDDRKSRLSEKGNIDENTRKAFDKTEYPTVRVSLKEKFIYQNIDECTQMSDIHIVNDNVYKGGVRKDENLDKDAGIKNLKNQLVRYVSLMKHPGLVTPTHIERTMQFAFIAKTNSGCISRQVGAVITDEYFAVKAIGWNTTPEGQVPCLLRDCYTLWNPKDINVLDKLYSKYEQKDEINPDKPNEKIFRDCLKDKFGNKYSKDIFTGRNVSYCFKDFYNELKEDKNQVYTRSLHAEENAFLQISKYGGQSLKGGKLFTTASPCELCAKKAYQVGIKEIFYIDLYPGISKDHILECGSINQKEEVRPKMILFKGAIGRAYIQLYQPIISYKDEINNIIEHKKINLAIWKKKKKDNI